MPLLRADMHHVNKGSIGLFAQGAMEIDVVGLKVSNIKNYGADGERSCGKYEVLHLGASIPEDYPALPGHTGYSGKNAYGVVLSAVTGFRVHPGNRDEGIMRSRVTRVRSDGALATGIMISTAASQVDVASLEIDDINGERDDLAGAYPPTCKVRVLNAGAGVHIPGGRRDGDGGDGGGGPRHLLRRLLGGGGGGKGGGGGGGGGGDGGGGGSDGGRDGTDDGHDDSPNCNIYKYRYPDIDGQQTAAGVTAERENNFFNPQRHCRKGRDGQRC